MTTDNNELKKRIVSIIDRHGYWSILSTPGHSREDLADSILYILPEQITSLKQMPCIDGEYQCQHVKEGCIDTDCVWCALTLAEKGCREMRGKVVKIPSFKKYKFNSSTEEFKRIGIDQTLDRIRKLNPDVRWEEEE